MFIERLVSATTLLTVAVAFSACRESPTGPLANQWIEVDLTVFPGAGGVVPNQTVLNDQWASVGILFDASPAGVDLIKEDFGGGDGHIFFSPDVFGVVAMFEFVDPATRTPVDVTAFTLVPWFNPGESAELVGLNASGAEVVVDAVTPADIGNQSLSIEMSIEGTFRTVEWRTQGDPGIAARGLAFKF